MQRTIQNKTIRGKRGFLLAIMAASVIGFALPVMAAPPLPREPMPKPHITGIQPGAPKPPVHIGTRPHFNPSNIGALPDLKIVQVTPRINTRVAGICRTGRKDRPGSSIPVLNFDVVVKNVGRGTAYMDRYGVILSAQTMDFHERVFDTNKRYQGGTGGPGHFQGSHGSQPWLLVRMGQIAPGATFTAHSGLGIGRNNTRFTIARMHELAGQTHRFRIKLTSYGSPGLKEADTRNNEYIVSYTFPRNFCETTIHGGVSSPIGNQTIKPNITGFQFAGGKNCVSPGGVFVIKGNAFGNSAGGRTVELGGNGMGVDLSIQSWNNRAIRVQLPRTARLQYRKNYWVRIKAPAVAGSARTLSNLKRGVVLCSPSVHVGASNSSGSQAPGQQNGGRRTVTVATGLPDLEITSIHFDKTSCFQPSTGAGEHGRFIIPLIHGKVTVTNTGQATYDTRKKVLFAVFLHGGRAILSPLRSGSHGSRYALVATMGGGGGPGVWRNVKIEPGRSLDFPVYLHLYHSLTAHRLGRGDDRVSFTERDARSVLGNAASLAITVGPRKHYRLNKKAALESNYENNSRRVLIKFPSLECGGRL